MKKRKGDDKPRGGKETRKSSFSPWWDHRKQQLSEWLTFGDDLRRQSKKLSWIQKSETSPSSPPSIEVRSQFQEETKIVNHSNNLSKEELNEYHQILRSLKIRIKPTEEQKKIFHKIFGVTRFVYNKAIDFVKAGHKPTFTTLKGEILNGDNNPEASQYPWLFDHHNEVPRDAKDMAIHELCSSIAATKGES